MKTRISIGQRIAVTCVVAFGIAVLWGLAFGWIGSIVRMVMPAPEFAYQSLQVSFDGTPVIATQAAADSSITVERRTLDGKSWPLDDENWLSSAYFHRPYKPPGVVEIPPRWSDANGRIAGATDGKLPPNAWYFIRNDKPEGHVYVAGYDAFSKLSVGFLGKSGFSACKPGLADQWHVPNVVGNEMIRVLSSNQSLERNALVRYHQLWERDTPPQWFVYVLEPDQLWEVDLRERTARSVAKFNGAMSIDRLMVSKETFDQLESKTSDQAVVADQNTAAKSDAADSNTASQNQADKAQPEYAMLMAVREPDRLAFFDLPSGKRQEFLIPQPLLDRRFSVFMLGADQLLFLAHEQEADDYWSGGPIGRLYWSDRDGKFAREKEVKLAGWGPESPRTTSWAASGVAPAPIAWIVGMLLGGPLYVMQINEATSFTGAMARVFGYAWPPFVVVLIVSIILALLTVKLQHKYRRESTGAWCAFVFLFGIAGFIAYWLENRRPKLEACADCGEIVPRDRDVCAACSARFPAPQPVGTEIFA